MSALRVLISGGGIAGLSLALCLRRRGHDALIIERAPQLRDQGYMIDFFGSGYDAAERLDLLPDLAAIHDPVARLAFVGPEGQKRFSVHYPALRRRLFRDRHFNFMRGDLERVLFEKVHESQAIRFGTQVDSFEDIGTRVRVRLTDGSTEEADLLVAADGVHSRVRELAFGPEREFVRPLGYNTAAFVVEDAALREQVGDRLATLTEPGRQAALYPIRSGRVAVFFVHKALNESGDHSRASALAELKTVYRGMRWAVPRLLEHAGTADIHVDAVSQVVVSRWHRRRTVLLGDAGYCVSLLAGQGASLAMAGAYILAEELATSRDDIISALARYESRLRPGVERKQAAGRGLARWFVPESRVRILARDLALRMSAWPIFSNLVGRAFAAESILRK
jgi:2-polyprenyl-6-methoxyphenol hydroxylase-like FAD-dependent oxidoreductase